MIPELKPWFEREFRLELPDWRFPLELERLRALPVSAGNLVNGLSRVELTTQLSGKWSIQEQVGHLILLEELGEGRIDDFENGKEILRGADLANTKTTEGGYRDARIEELIDRLTVSRAHFITRLEALDSRVQQARSLHPRIKQMMRPVDLMYFIAEHDNHHLAWISSIVRRLRTR